jgi:hypothetical protein
MAAVGMMFILFTLLRILAMISVAMSREHPMPLFGEGAVSLIGLGARWLVLLSLALGRICAGSI